MDTDCFRILAIMNITAMNMGIQMSLSYTVFIVLNIYPEVELLDDMVGLFLIFWGNSILFSIMVLPIYIPINSVQIFPFLHLSGKHSSLAFLITANLTGWSDISLWFRFAFPWWLVMLSIFLCACCPSVCLLWRNVLSLLSIFGLDFLLLSCMSYSYILETKPLSVT